MFASELSFFSRDAHEPGAIVGASIRGRTIPALVVESKDAREDRLNVRGADFTLKKLSAHSKSKQVFSQAFIAACHDTALWHGVHVGSVFALLTSQNILGDSAKLASVSEQALSKRTESENIRAEVLMLQAEKSERVSIYRNLVREAFARKSSVLILAPTIIEAETLVEELKRGIEEQVVLMTSEMPKKKLITEWNRSVESEKPLLIVAMAFGLSIPRATIDTIILERESARSWRSMARPHIDIRRAAENVARHTGTRFICADFPVRAETRYRVDIHEMEELARSQTRVLGTTEARIIDRRVKDEMKGTKRMFRSFSVETEELIRTEIAKGGRAAVFAARRGIAPLTVCNDCGTAVTDPETGVPMILHKRADGNVFLSHRSGAILPAEISCAECGGWNLVTLGIGVERVADELGRVFPDTKITVFTKDTAPSYRSAKKMSETFFAESGGILVGTERMLPFITEPVEAIVVASLDSILSVPLWRADEHALSILFYLRERAENSFIVETRKPESRAMKALASGNPTDFYRDEIREREEYQYPPFTVFIGLSWQGTLASVEKNRIFVAEAFKDTDLVGPLPGTQETKTLWRARAVIRVSRKEWPNEILADRLRALPPDIEVEIDPDEIV